MKKVLLALTASTLALMACTTPPTQNEVNAITNICLVDSGIRPLVTALEVLATPEEVAGLTTARAVIDPICANPAGSVASNAVAVLTNNVANIQAILIKLQARKAGK
jgi:hypothetical protein